MFLLCKTKEGIARWLERKKRGRRKNIDANDAIFLGGGSINLRMGGKKGMRKGIGYFVSVLRLSGKRELEGGKGGKGEKRSSLSMREVFPVRVGASANK